jgi:ABC-type sulfate transport system permease component
MRALCGAIITAGALIGLGLAAIGIGMRYQSYPYLDQDGNPQWVLFKSLDTSLMIALVVLLMAVLVGMAVAFVGLGYHHHRRHQEFLMAQGRHSTNGGHPRRESIES